MKKHILFIAEYNNILKELYTTLEDSYDVQMCLPKINAIIKSLKVYPANMILVNLNGLNNDDFKDSARAIGMNAPKTMPIVIIGAVAECEDFITQLNIAGRKAKNIQEGQMTTFCIYRPITNAKIIEKIQKRFGEGSNVSKIEEQKVSETAKKILMIDDDPMMIRLIAKQLAPDYKIIASTSGSDGLAKMESIKPDAVFLDYEMPGFNGEQILRMIHENELIKDIPVYMLTGKADKETVTTLLALRPNGYFLKNGDINLIKKTMNELFGKPQYS